MASVIGLDQTSQKLQFLDRLSTTGSVAVQRTPTTTSTTTTTTTTTTNTTTTTVITTFTTTKYFYLCNRACVCLFKAILVGYSVMRLTTHNTIAKRGIPSTANGLHSLFYFEFASKRRPRISGQSPTSSKQPLWVSTQTGIKRRSKILELELLQEQSILTIKQ